MIQHRWTLSEESSRPKDTQTLLVNSTCAELRHADVIRKSKRPQIPLLSVNLAQLFPN